MSSTNKTEIINIRVSKEQKDLIRKTAKNLGMNVSKYLMHLVIHGSVVMVDGGKELAMEMYKLNQHLNHIEKHSFLDVQELRDTVSNGIEKICKVKERI